MSKKTAKEIKHVNLVLPTGFQLNNYKIIKKLASGGFGVVYLAIRNDGQEVAIKEFLPQSLKCRLTGTYVNCSDPYGKVKFEEGMKSFFKEADMLMSIESENIISIWDVFKENGTAYFSMPVEKGGTLYDLTKKSVFGLSEKMLVSLFEQAALGIKALHENSLLHLDIKPNNLWVRPDGKLLVLDLGASRWESELSNNQQIARTPGFAAPEQHSSSLAKTSINTSTDIYGLSASLYASIANAAPPPAPQRYERDFPTRKLSGLASPQLLQLIEKGLSLKQYERPTIDSFIKDLREIQRLTEESSYWSFYEVNQLNNKSPKNNLYKTYKKKSNNLKYVEERLNKLSSEDLTEN